MGMLFGWRDVAVEVDGREADVELLGRELPPFYSDRGRVVARAELERTGDQLTVHLPGGLTFTGARGPDLFRAGASRLELLVAAALHDRVAVHAGVVAWRGRAVVLPGMTMHGKSTLVHALVASGATYLSDEFALFDDAGLVWPYPRRMTMRSSAGIERFLPDGAASEDGPGMPVGLIAAVRYDELSPHVLAPRSRAQSAMALLGNCLSMRQSPDRSLRALTSAAGSATGVGGSRGDAGATAERLLQMLV